MNPVDPCGFSGTQASIGAPGVVEEYSSSHESQDAIQPIGDVRAFESDIEKEGGGEEDVEEVDRCMRIHVEDFVWDSGKKLKH